MDDLTKLASGLWSLASADPYTGDARQLKVAAALTPHVVVKAAQDYVEASLPDRGRRLRAYRHVCDLASQLRKAAGAPEIPPGSTASTGTGDQPQTLANAPGNQANVTPDAITDPAGAMPPAANAMTPPASHVDQAAMLIGQQLAAGAQIDPAQIIAALQQAAAQDHDELIGQLGDQVGAQAEMHARNLLGQLPLATQVGTGAQLMQSRGQAPMMPPGQAPMMPAGQMPPANPNERPPEAQYPLAQQ